MLKLIRINEVFVLRVRFIHGFILRKALFLHIPPLCCGTLDDPAVAPTEAAKEEEEEGRGGRRGGEREGGERRGKLQQSK